MEISTWLLFSGIALVSIVSPGPAVLLSITNSLAHGPDKAVVSSLGNISGILIVSATAAMGLGAVLKTSELLFVVLKIVGAAYLIYLGIRQWHAKNVLFSQTSVQGAQNHATGRFFLQGVFIAVSNPKAVLFFTALFPQFIDLSQPVAFQFFVLTATFMAFSFFTLLIYALGANAFKKWFAIGSRAIWFNRIAGMVFVSFGLGILRLKNRAA